MCLLQPPDVRGLLPSGVTQLLQRRREPLALLPQLRDALLAGLAGVPAVALFALGPRAGIAALDACSCVQRRAGLLRSRVRLQRLRAAPLALHELPLRLARLPEERLSQSLAGLPRPPQLSELPAVGLRLGLRRHQGALRGHDGRALGLDLRPDPLQPLPQRALVGRGPLAGGACIPSALLSLSSLASPTTAFHPALVQRGVQGWRRCRWWPWRRHPSCWQGSLDPWWGLRR
mmetsp:Transcript_63799/g.186601  ORF Transcript_63799/g.186601 Transcript_63799/m.186601 type:complete len:232 (+) Transcript_63799:281-976(+)